MMMNATHLRSNLYKVLDQVHKSGSPLEIVCKDQKFLLKPLKPKNKFANAKKRKTLTVDPQSIVHMDWSREWKPFLK